MVLMSVLLLLVLGVLGIAPQVASRRPQAASAMRRLDAYRTGIGVVGLVWALTLPVLLLGSPAQLRIQGGALTTLLTALAIAALSLVVAWPRLRAQLGRNGFVDGVGRLTDRLAPLRFGLGVACLTLALLTLLRLLA